jgi:hypothetical protein
VSDCPSCGETLGLLRADEVKVGALYKHRCGKVLVLVSASTTELVVRLATDAEKAPVPLVPVGKLAEATR